MLGTLTTSVSTKTVYSTGARAARAAGDSATSVSVNRLATSRSPTTSPSANCIRFSYRGMD
jgi:hypothetical protein